jgi:M-phase inducer tyrosine phosphatase
MNNHVYPKVHFPEVYVLEGGYCEYFKNSGPRCQPSGGYVRMDDPSHALSRREDLDQFRKAKFGRTKSYAYGDSAPGAAKLLQHQQKQKRNTAPGTGTSGHPLFAAANAARNRRGGLTTLPEDGNTTGHSDDEDTDIGDSPCPPPSKGAGAAFKGKKISRAPLARAETCGLIRMAY